MKFVPDNVAAKVARPMLKLRKVSPQVMFGVGVVGIVGAGVLACRATLKLDETLEKQVKRELDIQFLTDNNVRGSSDPQSSDYTYENYDKHMAVAKVKFVLDIAKLYAPAVGLTVVSIALLTGSHVTLTRRNAATAAAYATLNEAYGRYRDGVIEKYGKDEDDYLRQGVVTVEESVTDDAGKVKKVKQKRSGGLSPYAQCFEESNENWRPGGNTNWFFLHAQERYWNNQLQTIGHVFLNDVYKSLGLQPTKPGQVVGWVAGETKGDGYISFGIFENERSERVRDFMTGAEDSIWLDFNVDGVVLDMAFTPA